MASTSEAPPMVAEIVSDSGASSSDLHGVAPHLSIHMLRHIIRGTSSGITYAVALVPAFEELAKQRRADAERYERAAEQLKTAPPPTVAEILAPLGVPPLTIQKANRDNLSVNTLHSILRKGKGRISGNAHTLAIAAALHTLAKQARKDAHRYEDAAEALRKHYPDRRVFKTVSEPGEGTADEHIIVLARAGEKLAAIGRTFGISRQRVHERVTAWEKRTGEKIQRYGKPYVAATTSKTDDVT